MTKHSALTAIHVPYNWEYDDATEREAATGFVPGDVGKLARQLDDNSLWMLIDDSPETWIAIGGSGGGGIVDYAIQRYTAGNITLNNTSWTDVPGPADLVVDASNGDLLDVGLSCLWGAETPEVYLDFATRVSGAPVNYISGGAGGASNRGVVGWQSAGAAAENHFSQGSIPYVVQAGDISGGTVTLRLRFRGSAGSNKTLFATSDIPLHLFVKNLGQP